MPMIYSAVLDSASSYICKSLNIALLIPPRDCFAIVLHMETTISSVYFATTTKN
jgi:hypothetical protein